MKATDGKHFYYLGERNFPLTYSPNKILSHYKKASGGGEIPSPFIVKNINFTKCLFGATLQEAV